MLTFWNLNFYTIFTSCNNPYVFKIYFSVWGCSACISDRVCALLSVRYTQRPEETISSAVELQSQTVVSHLVSAGNPTRVPL